MEIGAENQLAFRVQISLAQFLQQAAAVVPHPMILGRSTRIIIGTIAGLFLLASRDHPANLPLKVRTGLIGETGIREVMVQGTGETRLDLDPPDFPHPEIVEIEEKGKIIDMGEDRAARTGPGTVVGALGLEIRTEDFLAGTGSVPAGKSGDHLGIDQTPGIYMMIPVSDVIHAGIGHLLVLGMTDLIMFVNSAASGVSDCTMRTQSVGSVNPLITELLHLVVKSITL